MQDAAIVQPHSFTGRESKAKKRTMIRNMALHMAKRQHPQSYKDAAKWYMGDAERACEALLNPTTEVRESINRQTDNFRAYKAGILAVLNGW